MVYASPDLDRFKLCKRVNNIDIKIISSMRRPNQQYYTNRTTSFYTPQTTSKLSTHRPNLAMTQRNFNNTLNK